MLTICGRMKARRTWKWPISKDICVFLFSFLGLWSSTSAAWWSKHRELAHRATRMESLLSKFIKFSEAIHRTEVVEQVDDHVVSQWVASILVLDILPEVLEAVKALEPAWLTATAHGLY